MEDAWDEVKWNKKYRSKWKEQEGQPLNTPQGESDYSNPQRVSPYFLNRSPSIIIH